MKSPIVFFISLLSVLLLDACSHRTELKQEVLSVNDFMPLTISRGLVADSVGLEGDEVVFYINLDEAFFPALEVGNPVSEEAMGRIIYESWLQRSNPEFIRRLQKANCTMRYHLNTRPSNRTIDIHIKP